MDLERHPSPPAPSSLAELVRHHLPRVLAQWELLTPHPRLRAWMPRLLENLALATESSQEAELLPPEPFELNALAEDYAALRRALFETWETAGGIPPGELSRVNALFDGALRAAMDRCSRAREAALGAFEQVAMAALDASDVRLGLPKLLDALREACPAVDSAAVFAWEDQRPHSLAAQGQETSVGERLAVRVAESHQPLLLELEGPLPGAAKGADTRRLYGLPLLAGEKLMGVAQMGSPRNFSGEELYLFRAMAQRATELLVHHAHLQAMDKEREEFINSLVHDLKTPLSTIRGMAQLAHHQLGRDNQAPLAEKMLKVDRQAVRMSRMLNDLLDARLLAHGRLTVELAPVRYQPLLLELCEQWRATSADHRLHLTADDVWVTADRARLVQVLNNLLNNAIKYSPHGGDIYVEVRADLEAVSTSIRDPGVGVAPQEQQLIFERYTRSRHPRVHGRGIGLFVASELVRAQGGRLWVESEPPKGATFHFTLPASAGPS